jgi:DNA-binding Lrp family transcriptional regulator
MRLLPIDGRILSTVSTTADLEVPAIAKLLGTRPHVVRHALLRLTRQGIIRPLWVIDSFRLGWARYNAFLSLSLSRKQDRERAITFLRHHPSIAFLSESGADYDYEVSIFGRDPTAPVAVFEELTKQFGACITSKTVCTRTMIAFFTRKYLSKGAKTPKPLVLRQAEPVADLDRIDRTILTALSRTPAASRREIARTIGLPAATVDSRIRKLVEAKVIAGKIFAITNSHYGGSSYLLLLHARGFDPSLKERLYKYSLEHPHCTHYVEGFGSWDYEMGVEVLTHQELVGIRQEVSELFGAELAAIRTVPRLGVLRYESLPPLPL